MLRNDNIRMMAGGEIESQPSKPIRLLSLFSGIGAFEKALDRENIPYELASFCEIDKFAVKSYCAVHSVSEDENLGDISKIDTADIPDCDLVTYGFCCQDISVAGKQAGIIAGVTRSGLLYEALRIIEAKKPSYAICENVKNLVGKKFKPDFDKLLFMLDELGYNSYWQVLNAKDYGIPQNKERVFVISIRKDIDNGTFKFPEKFPLELRLKDMLEGDVDDKFYLTPSNLEWLVHHNARHEEKGTGFKFKPKNPETDVASTLRANGAFAPTDNAVTIPHYESVTPANDNYAILNGGKIGKMTDIYRRAYYEDGVAPTLHTCPGGNTEAKGILLDDTQGFDDTRVYKDYSPTLRVARSGLKVATDFRIRKLTPKECWRLMGFDDSDFDKAKAAGISASQLYKQARNSIVVNVLQYIFRNLFKGGVVNEA